MSKKIGAVGLTRALRDFLGVGGNPPPNEPLEVLQDVDEKVTPTVVLANDRPEWKVSAGEILMVGGATMAGQAGQFGMGILGFVAGKKGLLILDRVYVRRVTAGIVQYRRVVDGFLAAGGQIRQPLDSRALGGWAAAAPSGDRGVFQVQAAAPLPGTVMAEFWLEANRTALIDFPVILRPGKLLYIVNTTAAEDITVTAVWREREAGEFEAGARP